MIKASTRGQTLPSIPWEPDVYGIEVVELSPDQGWALWDSAQAQLDAADSKRTRNENTVYRALRHPDFRLLSDA